jgi:DNA polymerase
VFVSSFTLAPNAHLAISIANNGTLSFLSTVTGECIRKIEGFASLSNLFSSQTNIAISSNGELALWGSESKVILLDIATGNIIQEYVGHTDNVTFVAFFPNDDFVLSVSKDNTINVWDIYYGYCTFTFYDENCSCISSVFVGPDNILISVGDQGNLYFWDWATEKCLSKHEMHSAKITSLAFSTDERLFLTGSDDCTCCLWDITTYECLQIFKGHSGPIRDVGFLSNDRVVVSAGHDGIRYWERETGKELARSYIFDDNSWAIIAPDGSYDSSDNGASKHLRWTAGLISYPVTRFKSRYYTPGLLSNILGLETLDDIRKDLGDCHRCNLGDTRTNLVFGAGNPKARLVFVGEAPSGDEDRQGLPFVGEAGQLLTKIIKAMGFNQDEVYICNVLKCRPPRNRYPEPDEVKLCYPFLHRQIEAINPDVIFALGPIAAQTLLRTKESITRLRGVFQDYHGIPLMPTFPPVYLLRYASMKRGVWEDMKKVMKLLGKVPPEIGRAGSSG